MPNSSALIGSIFAAAVERFYSEQDTPDKSNPLNVLLEQLDQKYSYLDEDLEFILSSIEEFAKLDRYDLIDTAMRTSDMSTESTAVAVGVLSFTYPFRDKLTERAKYRLLLEQKLVNACGFDVTRELIGSL